MAIVLAKGGGSIASLQAFLENALKSGDEVGHEHINDLLRYMQWRAEQRRKASPKVAERADERDLMSKALQLRVSSPMHTPTDSSSTAAAVVMTVGMAAAAQGSVPSSLLGIVSPFRSQLEELKTIGKGGFGTVSVVRSRLDSRMMAIKKVPFKSHVAPWSPREELEGRHAKMLREVKALAQMEFSPHVVRYFSSWLEPNWDKLGSNFSKTGKMGAPNGQGTASVAPGRGVARATTRPRGMRSRSKSPCTICTISSESTSEGSSGSSDDNDSEEDSDDTTEDADGSSFGYDSDDDNKYKESVRGAMEIIDSASLGSNTFDDDYDDVSRTQNSGHSFTSASRNSAFTFASASTTSSQSRRYSKQLQAIPRDLVPDSLPSTGLSGAEFNNGVQISELSSGGEGVAHRGGKQGQKQRDSSRTRSECASESSSGCSSCSGSGCTRDKGSGGGRSNIIDGSRSKAANGASTRGVIGAKAGGINGSRTYGLPLLLRGREDSETSASATGTHASESETGSEIQSGSSSESCSETNGNGSGSSGSGSETIGSGSESSSPHACNENAIIAASSPFRRTHTPEQAWASDGAGILGFRFNAPEDSINYGPSGNGRSRREARSPPRGSRSRAEFADRMVYASRGSYRWPYMMYIAMELISGDTLDVWMKKRVSNALTAPPPPTSPLDIEPGGCFTKLGRTQSTGSTILTSQRMAEAAPMNTRTAKMYRQDYQRQAAAGGHRRNRSGTGLGDGGALGQTERDIFVQLVTGVAHCHAAGIIHRDLKPANIFVIPLDACAQVMSGKGRERSLLVKLCDFGLAVDDDSTEPSECPSWMPCEGQQGQSSFYSSLRRSASSSAFTSISRETRSSSDFPRGLGRGQESISTQHTAGVGTASYAAPEQMKGQGHYGPAVDIFPLGLMLMELCCGFTTGMERAMAMKDAREGILPTSMLARHPLESKLTIQLLSSNPSQRPTALELLAILEVLWGNVGCISPPPMFSDSGGPRTHSPTLGEDDSGMEGQTGTNKEGRQMNANRFSFDARAPLGHHLLAHRVRIKEIHTDEDSNFASGSYDSGQGSFMMKQADTSVDTSVLGTETETETDGCAQRKPACRLATLSMDGEEQVMKEGQQCASESIDGWDKGSSAICILPDVSMDGEEGGIKGCQQYASESTDEEVGRIKGCSLLVPVSMDGAMAGSNAGSHLATASVDSRDAESREAASQWSDERGMLVEYQGRWLDAAELLLILRSRDAELAALILI